MPTHGDRSAFRFPSRGEVFTETMSERYDFTGEVVQLAEPPMYQIIISRFPEGQPASEGTQRVLAVIREGEQLPDVLFPEADEANQYLLEGLNRLQQGLMEFPEQQAEQEEVIQLDMNYEVVEE